MWNQDRWYHQPSTTPLENEDANKTPEASSVLVMRLPFY